MKQAKVKGFCDILRNRRLGFAMISLAAVACVFSCIAGKCFSNGNNRITLLSTSITRTDAVLPAPNPTTSGSAISSGYSGQWQTVQMRVTAYCPCSKCCGKYSDGITASGHTIQPGDCFVAADKKHPFGTEMIIAGYNDGKPVKVLDRGGAINENRLDVFFDSHQKALEWGVRYLDVKVCHR